MCARNTRRRTVVAEGSCELHCGLSGSLVVGEKGMAVGMKAVRWAAWSRSRRCGLCILRLGAVGRLCIRLRAAFELAGGAPLHRLRPKHGSLGHGAELAAVSGGHPAPLGEGSPPEDPVGVWHPQVLAAADKSNPRSRHVQLESMGRNARPCFSRDRATVLQLLQQAEAQLHKRQHGARRPVAKAVVQSAEVRKIRDHDPPGPAPQVLDRLVRRVPRGL